MGNKKELTAKQYAKGKKKKNKDKSKRSLKERVGGALNNQVTAAMQERVGSTGFDLAKLILDNRHVFVEGTTTVSIFEEAERIVTVEGPRPFDQLDHEGRHLITEVVAASQANFLNHNPRTIRNLHLTQDLLAERILKGDKFKEYVHKRLNDMGVPQDPDPVQTRATDCRIGGRLDWIATRINDNS